MPNLMPVMRQPVPVECVYVLASYVNSGCPLMCFCVQSKPGLRSGLS